MVRSVLEELPGSERLEGYVRLTPLPSTSIVTAIATATIATATIAAATTTPTTATPALPMNVII